MLAQEAMHDFEVGGAHTHVLASREDPTMKTHIRDFFHLPSGRGHHGPALRVGAGIAVPLMVVVLLGRLDLSVYVIFAALTGVFGRADPHWLRFKHLVFAGALMSASVIAGAAASMAHLTSWTVVAIGTVMAGGLSVVSDWWGLRPAGPFFYLFAFTTAAGVPFTGALWEAVVAVIGTGAVVVVLGFVGVLYTRRWRSPAPGRGHQLHPPRLMLMARSARYAAAVSVSGSVAISLELGHFNWAMLAATAPIAATDVPGALARTVHNIVGTYVGVALSAVLLLVEWTPLGLVLLLALLQFASEVYVIRHYSLALIFLTPMALMMTTFGVNTPAHLLIYDRIVGTTIGATLAAILVLLTHSAVYRPRAWHLVQVTVETERV